MSNDKRANCAALELVVNAAKKHVEQVERDLGDSACSEEWSELGTAILMMESYVEQHSLTPTVVDDYSDRRDHWRDQRED